MNNKLKMVLLGILFVSLMVSTASAANIDNHIAGTGTMAHPTSNDGIAGCNDCHDTLGSPTTSGFCTDCHSFPVFKLAVVANPNTVPAGSLTSVSFAVTESNNVKNIQTPSNGATVTLTGAATGSGTTTSAGSAVISVNPASSGPITATAAKTGFNSGTVTVTASADTTAPVITMVGSSPIDVTQGSTYTDAGATALDNIDGDLTSAIVTDNSVDTTVIGPYTVTYNVTDTAGNNATEVVRTVNVVAAPVTPDTTAPVITMIGSSPIDVTQGTAYTDSGATALDNIDGDLTSAIVTDNSVDTTVIGPYTVTYNVTDAAGNNATEVVRNVNVVAAAADTTPPVITMLGSTPLDIVVGSVYTDAGATASDNVDGDLTPAIVTVNSVDTEVIESYTVTYNVVDAAGNNATEVVRTVNVVAATPPRCDDEDDEEQDQKHDKKHDQKHDKKHNQKQEKHRSKDD